MITNTKGQAKTCPLKQRTNMDNIRQYLTTSYVARDVRYFDEVASTNTEAKNAADAGNGALFIADTQTAGRGRLGRGWASPAGCGIWMSLLLTPDIAPERIPQITLVAGMAVCRAIGGGAMIKWPNDIVISTKKICGILTEYSGGRVICGIGINVNTPAFPQALSHIATSLYLETGRETDRAALAASVMNHFEPLYDRFLSGGFAALADEYKKLCVTIGRKVTVTGAGDTIRGTAAGITPDGGLVLDTADGKKIITSGEASVRGIYGYI